MQRLLASISTPTLSVICPFGLLLWLYTASITRLWLAAVPGDETIFRHNSSLCGPRTYCVFLDDQYGMGAIYRDPTSILGPETLNWGRESRTRI